MSAEIEVEVDVVCSVRVKVMIRDGDVTLNQAMEQARKEGVRWVNSTLNVDLPDHVKIICSPHGHARGLKAVA